MASRTTVLARIASLETALGNRDGSVDFMSSGGDSLLQVTNTAQSMAQLRKNLRYWKMELWKLDGSPMMEPQREGVDAEKNTSNNDT